VRARGLFSAMRNEGFKRLYPIPIDPNGELLDGAHRTTCAIALKIKVHVRRVQKEVWAPPWARQWFIEHDCETNDLERIDADFERCQLSSG
jgi:hypothetical protein